MVRMISADWQSTPSAPPVKYSVTLVPASVVPCQSFFQRYVPWVLLIALPGKLMRTMAGESAGCTYHLKTSPPDRFLTSSVEQLVKLAVLYNTSVDYMLGMENRSYLYLDDLSESQQRTVLDVVDRPKKEFLSKA